MYVNKFTHLLLAFAIVLMVTHLVLCFDNRQRENHRNNSNSNNDNKDRENNDNDENENVMKIEAKKYMRQCGFDNSDNNNNRRNKTEENRFSSNNDEAGEEFNSYYGENQRYGGSSNWNQGNTYSKRDYNRATSNYGGRRNSDDRTDFGDQTYRRGGNNDYNDYGSGTYGNQNNENPYKSLLNVNDYGYISKDPGTYRRGGYNQNSRYNRDNSQYGNSDDHDNNRRFVGNGYGTNERNPSGFGLNRNCDEEHRSNGDRFGTNRNFGDNRRDYGNTGYGSNGQFNGYLQVSPNRNRQKFRIRRYNMYDDRDRNNEDNQCLSQCLFGYLEILDENRTPSETLVIKWFQDHIRNNDMKRINALREARNCFGRLTTSDVDDGCEFSSELSKCLNLDLE